MNVKKNIFIINLSLDKKGSLNTFLQAMDAIQKKKKIIIVTFFAD